MKRISASDFESAADLAASIIEAAREVPVGGTRDRVTKEVSAWIAAQGLNPDDADEELLELYNRAAVEGSAEMRDALSSLSSETLGKKALILLLSTTGTTDQLRQLALDALKPSVGPRDARELARVNMKQRPSLLPAAIDVLATAGGGEALFALSKVFATREGEPGERARRRAESLRKEIAEARFVESLTQDSQPRSGDTPDLDIKTLLYCLLALESRAQARVANGTSLGSFLEPLGDAVTSLYEELQAAAGGSSSLAPYLMRVRDELLELVLILNLPPDDDLQKRAGENLFRREDLEDVEQLLAALPEAALSAYATRALTKSNRRGDRAERAEVAFRALQGAPIELRRSFRATALECLSEKRANLRFEASRLLIVDKDELDPEAKAALVATYEDLPPTAQRRLGRVLGELVEGRNLNTDAFLRWVESAKDDEIESRLDSLLQRWAAGAPDDSEVERYVRAVGDGLPRMGSTGASQPLGANLAEVAAGWLSQQDTRVAGPVNALLSWQGFSAITVSQLPTFAARLRSGPAQRLLVDSLAMALPRAPELVALAAGADLDEQGERNVLLPALEALVARAPDDMDAAIEAASDVGARRILVSALKAQQTARLEISRLEDALNAGTAETLLKHRAALGAALGEIEDSAAGNEALEKLFKEIRRTVGQPEQGSGAAGPDAEGAAPPDGREPSNAVVAWRQKAAETYPGVLASGTDARHNLALATGPGVSDEDLAALLNQLDKRAHSPRVAPVADRPAYAEDLRRILEQAIASNLVTVGDDVTGETGAREPAGGSALSRAIQGGSPRLRQMFWDLWGARGSDAESSGSDLATALERAGAEPSDPNSLAQLQGSLRAINGDELIAAVESQHDATVRAAWPVAKELLILDLRETEKFRGFEQEKEADIGKEVGTELDLPFKLIEQLLLSYFRFRQRLADAGWRQVEKQLGREIPRSAIRPDDHEVREEGESTASSFVVASLGIRFKGKTVSKAVLLPVDQDSGPTIDAASAEVADGTD